MSFDLGAVIAAVLTAVAGSVGALVVAFSPSVARVRRLEKLVEIRKDIAEPQAASAIDFAILELSEQASEDAFVLTGPGLTVMRVVSLLMALLGSVGFATQFLLPEVLWLRIVAFSVCAFLYVAGLAMYVLIGIWLPRQIHRAARIKLERYRDNQRGETTSAEGLTEGDVPSA